MTDLMADTSPAAGEHMEQQTEGQAPTGELLFTLTERERELLAPELEVLERARAEIEAARKTIAGASNAMSRMLELRAGRDDVVLDTGTWEVRVHSPPPAEPGG